MQTTTVDQLPIASTIDASADRLLIYTASLTDVQGINRNTLLGLTSQPTGNNDTQTLQNKTINSTNTITVNDSLFTMQNTSDTTKKALLSASGITTGNTRTLTLPDRSGTLATLNGNQAFTGTNTFTGGTFTAPVISNPTLSVDAISGFSTSTLGTAYGLSISNGVLNSNNSVKTSNLQNASVTSDKLNTSAATNTIATSETTTSTSYAGLFTGGPTVTVTIGANGIALVSIYAHLGNDTATSASAMSFFMSGANTSTPVDGYAIFYNASVNSAQGWIGATFMLTGLAAGSTTFTANYRVNGGTGTFLSRQLSVVPL